MTRVLSSACLVLLLLVGGRAWAGGKPSIAILGLEVYDNGSGIDPETTKAAKELTAALRDRAKAGTGPYALVSNGDKELIDEKLLNNCDSEAASCMAAIGNELNAELLMYGKIERSAQGGQPIYKVSIKLLNVNRKQLANSTVETLPISESSGVKVSTHARTWYAKLAGGNVGGTVTIRANIDRGTVVLDEEIKGNLASGTLTLSGLSEGRHTLAIEAKDYQRYETSITIRNGETLPHSAMLVELPKKPSALRPRTDPISVEGTVSKPKSNIWKPIFYGTTVLEAGAVGFAVFEIVQGRRNSGNISRTSDFANTFGQLDTSACSNKPANYAEFKATHPGNAEVQHFEDACKNWDLQRIGWVATGVVGAAMIGSFVMAFMRDGGTETQAANGRRKRRPVAITPVVTPDGAGATLRFDW